MKKAQTLLLVIILLFFISALMLSLNIIWQSELKTYSSEQLYLTALYLAQAGIERAKIDILYGCWKGGTCWSPGPSAQDWEESISSPNPNYIWRFQAKIESNCGNFCRNITGTGEILDTGNNVLAHREINCEIDGIKDKLPGGGDDKDDDLSGTPSSWHEI